MVSGDWGLAGGRLCDADRGAVACKWPIRGMSIPTCRTDFTAPPNPRADRGSTYAACFPCLYSSNAERNLSISAFCK